METHPEPGLGPLASRDLDRVAMRALDLTWTLSALRNLEYGGSLCRTSANNYVWTGPITDDPPDSGMVHIAGRADCRQGHDKVGEYHSHPRSFASPIRQGLRWELDLRTTSTPRMSSASGPITRLLRPSGPRTLKNVQRTSGAWQPLGSQVRTALLTVGPSTSIEALRHSTTCG